MAQKSANALVKDDQKWRSIGLTELMEIKSIHDHTLQMEVPWLDKHGNEVDSDDEYVWNCNGVEFFQGGCKSGISDFGMHRGIKAWRCYQKIPCQTGDGEESEDCDLDLCEMCMRWIVYCEQNGISLGRLI